MAKTAISKLLASLNLISRKIWMTEKSWTFYNLWWEMKDCNLTLISRISPPKTKFCITLSFSQDFLSLFTFHKFYLKTEQVWNRGCVTFLQNFPRMSIIRQGLAFGRYFQKRNSCFSPVLFCVMALASKISFLRFCPSRPWRQPSWMESAPKFMKIEAK